MKVVLVLCLIVGLSSANLAEDYKDFLQLLPVNGLRTVAVKCMITDPEYQRVISYVHSPEFKGLIEEILSNEVVKDFISFCYDSGLNVESLARLLYDIFIKTQEPNPHLRTMRKCIEDIKDVLCPIDWEGFFENKLATSADFKTMVGRLTSDKAKKIYEDLLNNKEVQHIFEVMKEFKIDLTDLICERF